MEKSTPSYMEYTVICENTADCWYIMVNVDGDDVNIPKASTSDYPASKILADKSGTKKEDLDFFYFWPFDVYAQNKITKQINAIDPQMDPIEDDMMLEPTIIEQKEKLSARLQEHIDFYTLYRKSEEYKKDTIIFQNKYGIQSPWSVQLWDWKYVKWNYTSNCNSRVPCYQQYRYWYGWQWCATGCSPVAVAMIYGYHDRMGNYPNLLPDSVAADINGKYTPEDIKNMIEELRWYMWTFCDWFAGSTYDSQIAEGKHFAWNQGYTMTHAGLTSYYMESWIKHQIDQWRPIVINIGGTGWVWHSIVGYGYFKPQNPPPNTSALPLVKINAGWGNNHDSNAMIDLSASFSLNSKVWSVDNVVYYMIQ